MRRSDAEMVAGAAVRAPLVAFVAAASLRADAGSAGAAGATTLPRCAVTEFPSAGAGEPVGGLDCDHADVMKRPHAKVDTRKTKRLLTQVNMGLTSELFLTVSSLKQFGCLRFGRLLDCGDRHDFSITHLKRHRNVVHV